MIKAGSFGQWVRQRRRELDLTQEGLARQVSCAEITLRKVEAGNMKPSRQLAGLLVQRLALPSEDSKSIIQLARGDAQKGRSFFSFPKHNLPVEISSFVGRERELAEVKRFLEKSRLVTLTGVGGVGKTRLALQTGADLLDRFQHGVWFVELASISDPDAVPQSLLSIFKPGGQTGVSPIAFLQEYLREKSALILLDNCEHVLDSAAQLAAALLKNAPGLRILATSREALNITGEISWRVPSLSAPDVHQMPARMDKIRKFDAVRLFVERASLVSPSFSLDRGNVLTVVQICRLLDGIPLAIELAAARLREMTVEQIRDHLDERFNLLVKGSRDALPRHQTLKACIDWSYDLLSEPEKILLQRVSVFVGGWTREAVEQVCGDRAPDAPSIFERLARLVDQSLVVAGERSAYGRYQILETVRQYAREKLSENGESQALSGKHLDYFVTFAETMEQNLRTPAQQEALENLQMEMANLRAALAWAFSGKPSSRPDQGLRIACALERFTQWDFRLLREELEWFGQGLALLPQPDDGTNWLRAKALCLAGGLASQLGEPTQGRAMLERGIAMYRNDDRSPKRELAYALSIMTIVRRESGNAVRSLSAECIALCRTLADSEKWYLAEILRVNGWGAYWQNDFESARAMAEESCAIFRQLGDHFSLSDSVHLLGQIAHTLGEFEAARPLHEECLRLNESTGLKEYAILAIFSLADLDREAGNYSAARAGYEQALAYYREDCDQFAVGATLLNLGRLALLEGEIDEALNLLRESLSLFRETNNDAWIAIGLASLAEAIRVKGQGRLAAQLLGAVNAHIQAFKPITLAAYNKSVAATTALLDQEIFSSAWEQGETMELDQAVELAFRVG